MTSHNTNRDSEAPSGDYSEWPEDQLAQLWRSLGRISRVIISYLHPGTETQDALNEWWGARKATLCQDAVANDIPTTGANEAE